jgi:colicin import membrane protein
VRQQGGGYTWSLETIRSARDAQLRGQFAQPVRLAEAFRTNDALFTAYQARVATQSAIKLLWSAADSDAGRLACERAKRSILTPQHARESILGTLANHGLAIGYVQQTTADSPDGPEVSMLLTEWPLEHVRFNASTNTLETRTKDNSTITIAHGDGRWIVFRKFGVAPWTQDACVLPGALLWAAHGSGISDWASASFSHGQPKVIGTLREGVTLGNGETLTSEAQALLNTLAALVSGESGAGVLPAGSDAKLLYNGSTAWQVFKELVMNREKSAMRIYLGTDAALGSQGGAPGVDIASLFNVASTRIQGDLEALERGFREGMIEPWARMHGVTVADLPQLTYAMPDVDGERRSAQEASAVERLAAMVKSMKDTGLDVTQDTITALVAVLGISVPCTLAAAETKSIPIQLAPTDVARVVKVREARGAQGLPPLGDARDEMFISELEAAAAVAPAGAPGEEPPPPEDGGGGAPTPAPAPSPNVDGTVTVQRVTPAVRSVGASAVVTLASPLDADGDGKINEAEAEEGAAAAGAAIDGDGDGKVDEAEDDDPRVVKARKKVAKALEKHEAKKAQFKDLETQAADAQARREAAEARASQAEEDLSNVTGEIEEAESHLAELKSTPAADLDEPNWSHTDEAGNTVDVDGHESRRLTEADLAKSKARAVEVKAEHKAATKESRAAEREADKLDAKIENYDDGAEALDDAMGGYVDARGEVSAEADDALNAYENDVFGDDGEAELTPEQAEHHAALVATRDKRAAQATEADNLVGGGEGYEPESAPGLDNESDSPDRAKAIVTGPNGGKYYIASSGQKVYVP